MRCGELRWRVRRRLLRDWFGRCHRPSYQPVPCSAAGDGLFSLMRLMRLRYRPTRAPVKPPWLLSSCRAVSYDNTQLLPGGWAFQSGGGWDALSDAAASVPHASRGRPCAAGTPGRLTGHSGRVGLATELTARGATTTETMSAGGWASPEHGRPLRGRGHCRTGCRRSEAVAASVPRYYVPGVPRR